MGAGSATADAALAATRPGGRQRHGTVARPPPEAHAPAPCAGAGRRRQGRRQPTLALLNFCSWATQFVISVHSASPVELGARGRGEADSRRRRDALLQGECGVVRRVAAAGVRRVRAAREGAPRPPMMRAPAVRTLPGAGAGAARRRALCDARRLERELQRSDRRRRLRHVDERQVLSACAPGHPARSARGPLCLCSAAPRRARQRASPAHGPFSCSVYSGIKEAACAKRRHHCDW